MEHQLYIVHESLGRVVSHRVRHGQIGLGGIRSLEFKVDSLEVHRMGDDITVVGDIQSYGIDGLIERPSVLMFTYGAEG